MSELVNKIKADQATGFTHGGKFHADDVFASALLLYLNPDFEIQRGNQVPEDFDGVVYDIGRGQYDHHQRDSRIRENGIPYAAFGLLWDELGAGILGEELAQKFDEDFIQPLDLNDNTGEKNELASLIGDFNPSWDDNSSSDLGFYQAVGFAGMILENKFTRLRSTENARTQINECIDKESDRILVLPQFIPFSKNLEGTEIAFVIFPSNRGGYCIQPVRKDGSMNYRCCFPQAWLGLDGEELQKASGIASAQFCHKSGFIMTVTDLDDAKLACQSSIEQHSCEDIYVVMADSDQQNDKLKALLEQHIATASGEEKNWKAVPMRLSQLEVNLIDKTDGTVALERTQWQEIQKNQVRQITDLRPEAVVLDGTLLYVYPLIHSLRKKHIPVYVPFTIEGKEILVRIPSGS